MVIMPFSTIGLRFMTISSFCLGLNLHYNLGIGKSIGKILSISIRLCKNYQNIHNNLSVVRKSIITIYALPFKRSENLYTFIFFILFYFFFFFFFFFLASAQPRFGKINFS